MKCKERLDKNQEDSLALNVNARLEGTLDLVASKAKYHQNCRTSFSVMRPDKKVRAAANSEILSAFEMACDWMENQIEIVTVSKLCDKMREFNNSDKNYNTQ